MLKTAWAVAAKDLRIERRSKVTLAQVLPFALIVIVLFAFALDPSTSLRPATPGLYWVAVLLVLLLAVQRSFAVEVADGAFDAVRLAELDPAGVFLGKAGALAVQLLGVEAAMAVAVLVFYDPTARAAGVTPFHASVGAVVLFVTAAAAATAGLVATGTLYGALAAGSRVRDTLLPLLVFPVVAPVLIGATRATEAALGTGKATLSDGWPAVGLLAVFAAVAVATGVLAFGPLLEEA